MHPESPKRVAVAITADGGNTLCGFRTTASPRKAERMFASSVSRLRRAGHADNAPVVLSVDTVTENYASLREAERQFERVLELASSFSPTAEHVLQR